MSRWGSAISRAAAISMMQPCGRSAWCGSGPFPRAGGPVVPPRGSHLCFRAPERAAVGAFHAAALAAGGRDDGKPGLRSYHAAYYGAFVLDPDGHRIEAVCHAPEAPAIEA